MAFYIRIAICLHCCSLNLGASDATEMKKMLLGSNSSVLVNNSFEGNISRVEETKTDGFLNSTAHTVTVRTSRSVRTAVNASALDGTADLEKEHDFAKFMHDAQKSFNEVNKIDNDLAKKLAATKSLEAHEKYETEQEDKDLQQDLRTSTWDDVNRMEKELEETNRKYTLQLSSHVISDRGSKIASAGCIAIPAMVVTVLMIVTRRGNVVAGASLNRPLLVV